MKAKLEHGCRAAMSGGLNQNESQAAPWWGGSLGSGLILLFGAGCFFAGHSLYPAAPLASDSVVVQTHVAAAPLPAPAPPAVVIITTNFVSLEPQWSEGKWAELHAQLGTVARNAELAAMLEKLAATDPQRALALAQAEGNQKLRETLVRAVLHGWARTAPLDAANWANALTDPSAREAAMSSVFAGAAAANPAEAARVGALLIQQNPAEATGYGTRLIDALSDAGQFAAAAQLAGTGDNSVQRAIWLAEAYSKWSELQPAQAAQAASAVTDPTARSEALHGVVGGWAETDPAGLTQFLVQLQPDADRGQMIGQALENWAKLDPVATANWMNNHVSDLGGDLDKGMQSIATMAAVKPDVAVAWAEGITDQNLRSQALNDVLRNWLASDPQAAQNYFQATSNLLPNDRQQIAEIVAGLTTSATTQ